MKQSTWGLSSPCDTQHKLVTSPVFSPTVLACLRLTLAFYTLFTILFTLIWDSVSLHDASSYFSYFTQLTYIGLCSYFWASGVQTFAYARWRRYPLQFWPRALQFLHLLLQSTIVTFPIIVTIVYWALLSSASTFATRYSAYSAVSLHILNTVFALFEILLTNSPPAPWITLIFGILFLAGYLGVAYITHATQGFYTYSFLNPSLHHARIAGYIVAIGVGECVVFTIVRGVVVLRQRLFAGRGLISPSSEDNEPREQIDDWEHVDRPKTPVV